MIVEAVDLTTGAFVHDPEAAFRIAGKINLESSGTRKIGIEVYPFVRSIPTKIQSVSEGDVRGWQARHEARAIRVHLPFLYNWREIGYQAVRGDWYHGAEDWLMNQVVMATIGPATNDYGIKLAEGLNVGVNVHPNVIAGIAKDGRLDRLRTQVPFILGENSIEFNSQVLRDRQALGDPVATVERIVEPNHLDGLLLAVDHLFGLKRSDDPQVIQARLGEIEGILDNPKIQQYTRAMHLAFPGHGLIEVNNPYFATLLKKLAKTPFAHPVRLALDIYPKALRTKTEAQQVDYVKGMRDWIMETV